MRPQRRHLTFDPRVCVRDISVSTVAEELLVEFRIQVEIGTEIAVGMDLFHALDKARQPVAQSFRIPLQRQIESRVLKREAEFAEFYDLARAHREDERARLRNDTDQPFGSQLL